MKEPNKLTYRENKDIQYDLRLRGLIEELPRICKIFFRGIEPSTSSRTRNAYAFDLKNFFEFLVQMNPSLKGKEIREITTPEIAQISSEDIEEYLEYLKVYKSDDGKLVTNHEQGIKRKLCTLRSFYKYLFKNNILDVNPAIRVSTPKIHDKAIIRLDANETVDLLDGVEYGTANVSAKQSKMQEKNKVRDLAIVTLLLGTGIRVSECVGLDLQDIDFNNDRIKIVRKGGSEAFVYFGDEVKEALCDYLELRKTLVTTEHDENALFISSRHSRISVRNIEVLVKKYAKATVPLKKITPHKLRSTYGTSLYKETGDIYLVADVLGHKDVNTTRKHYAAIDEERRFSAKDKVHLRKD